MNLSSVPVLLVFPVVRYRAMRAGFAEVDFTPLPGLPLAGQMRERIAESIRDPLMACAAAFSDGDEQVVLVTADVCWLPDGFVRQARARFAERTAIPGERLLLHATHTHVAPATESLMAARADYAFVERLQAAILEAAETALKRRVPVILSAGTGRLEHLGWNRRAMFADGSSRMYGHSEQEGFVGMEGPRDPALPVVVARDGRGRIRGVLLSFATHPNCIEGASVYSADLPGEVRRNLKRRLGKPVGVIYLTAPAGNTAPSMLDPHVPEQPWRGEEGLRKSGEYVAAEAVRVLEAATQPVASQQLAVRQETLCVPIRPWPAETEANYPEPLRSDGWLDARSYYESAREAWPARLATRAPIPIRVTALRLGDAALCTSPAELFVEFGLQIRRISPTPVTLMAELTDGYCGYVPTRLAFSRGGYETWPAPSSLLAETAGWHIVVATARLLSLLFDPVCPTAPGTAVGI